MLVVVLDDRDCLLEITTTATHALQMMADRTLFRGLPTYVVSREDGKKLTQTQLLALAKNEAEPAATALSDTRTLRK